MVFYLGLRKTLHAQRTHAHGFAWIPWRLAVFSQINDTSPTFGGEHTFEKDRFKRGSQQTEIQPITYLLADTTSSLDSLSREPPSSPSSSSFTSLSLDAQRALCGGLAGSREDDLCFFAISSTNSSKEELR